ncbi:hypothetical protein PUN28_013036 [Cardiocondyla obscurior]|uniref:Secreted protein n=1 Tax=Cardiocondyla obscurior TaxID=286306 RepID=A0AAW2FBI4_9HYME
MVCNFFFFFCFSAVSILSFISFFSLFHLLHPVPRIVTGSNSGKIASRQLHPLVAIFAMFAVFFFSSLSASLCGRFHMGASGRNDINVFVGKSFCSIENLNYLAALPSYLLNVRQRDGYCRRRTVISRVTANGTAGFSRITADVDILIPVLLLIRPPLKPTSPLPKRINSLNVTSFLW